MPIPTPANLIVNLLDRGGPVMIPLLATALVAVAVVIERSWWWASLRRRRKPKVLDQVFAALEQRATERARRLSENHNDPLLRMIGRGLSHRTGSLTGALQVEAAQELQRAGRYLPAMDTMVTLAPLLGLLGTVTGIMESFAGMGGTELEIDQVTGGISEALISTAAGLAIAIAVLIPLNYFQTRLGRLQFDLENVATQVELLVFSPASNPGANQLPETPSPPDQPNSNPAPNPGPVA